MGGSHQRHDLITLNKKSSPAEYPKKQIRSLMHQNMHSNCLITMTPLYKYVTLNSMIILFVLFINSEYYV